MEYPSAHNDPELLRPPLAADASRLKRDVEQLGKLTLSAISTRIRLALLEAGEFAEQLEIRIVGLIMAGVAALSLLITGSGMILAWCWNSCRIEASVSILAVQGVLLVASLLLAKRGGARRDLCPETQALLKRDTAHLGDPQP
jgi:uncharacterized membrane protein YqjE